MKIAGADIRRFRLSDQFMARYAGQQPEWGPIGYCTYKRTYSRFTNEAGTETEEFWQTLQRVVEGTFAIQKWHCSMLNIPWDSGVAQKHAQRMFELMWNFKFLPSGRGLWLMGTDFVYEHGSAGLNSCAFVSSENIDRFPVEPFTWAMEALLLGVGVGFDTRGADKLTVHPYRPNGTYVIDDSREGWVESVRMLLEAFLTGHRLPKFDYSQIRPAGTILKKFGGVASGPGPLVDMHQGLVDLLGPKAGRVLSSGDIVDIFTLIARCVVSGNIRRSAMIALGEPNDTEFLGLKASAADSMTHRWAANNSVFGTVGMDYRDIVRRNVESGMGEPGIIWLENARKYGRLVDGANWVDRRAVGVNPCGEQTLEDKECCNLIETFPSRHASLEEYLETLKYALMYGKTVTLLDTQWPTTNAVIRRNRRLGISQSGVMDAIARFGVHEIREWCDKGYGFIRKQDRDTSDFLCIRESIKVTSVKPSGTISLLSGVSPGIHYPHAEYYIRRIRFAKNSALLPMLKAAGYKMEPDVTQPEHTVVVEFPVHVESFTKGKDQVTVWQQLENAVMYQRYWADNQVSITVSYHKDEVDDLVDALQHFDDRLKCVSLLPHEDHGYQQPPYEEIEASVCKKRISKIKPINYTMGAGDGAVGEKYCDNDTCSIQH